MPDPTRHQNARRRTRYARRFFGSFLPLMLSLASGLVGVAPAPAFERPSSGARLAEDLGDRVKKVLESPGFRHGHWGLLVVDGRSGQTVFERNGDNKQRLRPSEPTARSKRRNSPRVCRSSRSGATAS